MSRLMETYNRMTERLHSQVDQQQKDMATEYIQFMQTVYYSKFKKNISDRLLDMDRVITNDPNEALRLQFKRQALREILDDLEHREQVSKRVLRPTE